MEQRPVVDSCPEDTHPLDTHPVERKAARHPDTAQPLGDTAQLDTAQQPEDTAQLDTAQQLEDTVQPGSDQLPEDIDRLGIARVDVELGIDQVDTDRLGSGLDDHETDDVREPGTDRGCGRAGIGRVCGSIFEPSSVVFYISLRLRLRCSDRHCCCCCWMTALLRRVWSGVCIWCSFSFGSPNQTVRADRQWQ
jgi:hypothetical protein